MARRPTEGHDVKLKLTSVARPTRRRVVLETSTLDDSLDLAVLEQSLHNILDPTNVQDAEVKEALTDFDVLQ
jgi:hypothetical protein